MSMLRLFLVGNFQVLLWFGSKIVEVSAAKVR